MWVYLAFTNCSAFNILVCFSCTSMPHWVFIGCFGMQREKSRTLSKTSTIKTTALTALPPYVPVHVFRDDPLGYSVGYILHKHSRSPQSRRASHANYLSLFLR